MVVSKVMTLVVPMEPRMVTPLVVAMESSWVVPLVVYLVIQMVGQMAVRTDDQ